MLADAVFRDNFDADSRQTISPKAVRAAVSGSDVLKRQAFVI